MSDEEFNLFAKTLTDKLPVTFRINPGLVNYQELAKIFRDPEFILKYAVASEVKDDESKEVAEIKMGQADHYYKDTLKNV